MDSDAEAPTIRPDHFRANSGDAIDLTALAQFRFLIRQFLVSSENLASTQGLTPQQHQLLLVIAGRPPTTVPTISYLAERLVLKHHSTVGLVDRLEEVGLVVRSPGITDRRQVLVQLTERGRRVLQVLSIGHRNELRLLAPDLVEALMRTVEST